MSSERINPADQLANWIRTQRPRGRLRGRWEVGGGRRRRRRRRRGWGHIIDIHFRNESRHPPSACRNSPKVSKAKPISKVVSAASALIHLKNLRRIPSIFENSGGAGIASISGAMRRVNDIAKWIYRFSFFIFPQALNNDCIWPCFAQFSWNCWLRKQASTNQKRAPRHPPIQINGHNGATALIAEQFSSSFFPTLSIPIWKSANSFYNRWVHFLSFSVSCSCWMYRQKKSIHPEFSSGRKTTYEFYPKCRNSLLSLIVKKKKVFIVTQLISNYFSTIKIIKKENRKTTAEFAANFP